jgi:hypothetical protein
VIILRDRKRKWYFIPMLKFVHFWVPVRQIEIGLHAQFIGKILDIKADEGVLDEKGMLDIEKVRPIFFAPGTNAYYRMGEFLGEAFSIGQDVKKKP